MFFNFSSEKVARIFIITALLLLGVFALIYMDKRFEINQAVKLYSSKWNRDISYWTSHKLKDALNPGEPSFFLWKITGRNKAPAENLNSVTARSVPVLAYHGLPNEGIGQIPNDAFVDQMKTLKENGWNTVSLDDFKSFMKGEKNLPDKSFLLTFDDGRKDTFYPADPVLRDLGFKAVVFVISKRSLSEQSNDSTYYLSAYELREMEKSGRWDVESHGRDSHDWYPLNASSTIGHYFSNKLWYPEENRLETDQEFLGRIVYDLSHSKSELESALNKKVTAISYPFGDFGQDSINYPDSAEIVAKETARLYDIAFFQVRKGAAESFNYPENQFKARRIEPRADWSGKYLLQTMESGVAKNLPFSASDFGLEWVPIWGNPGSGENLALEAAAETTGASAILNGSYLWKDYTFTSGVNWSKGSNIVLMARQKDLNNYYGCNFGPNRVYIKEVSGGASRNILEQNYSPGKFPRTMELGIKVDGSNVSCLVNGEKILEGIGINDSFPNGSIGIEIWDAKPGNASAVFDNVSVSI